MVRLVYPEFPEKWELEVFRDQEGLLGCPDLLVYREQKVRLDQRVMKGLLGLQDLLECQAIKDPSGMH